MEDIFQTVPAKVKCRFPYKITFDFKMFVKCLEGHVIIYEIQRICCVMLPALSDGVSLKKKKNPICSNVTPSIILSEYERHLLLVAFETLQTRAGMKTTMKWSLANKKCWPCSLVHCLFAFLHCFNITSLQFKFNLLSLCFSHSTLRRCTKGRVVMEQMKRRK